MIGKHIFLKVGEKLQTGNIIIQCVKRGLCCDCCFDRDFPDDKIVGGELACKDMICSEHDRKHHINTVDCDERDVSFKIIEKTNFTK